MAGVPLPVNDAPSPVSDRFDETVEHAFHARLVERDLQLVALDAFDRSIAEFLVEDALSRFQVAARPLSDRDADRLCLDLVRSARRTADRRGALPSGAAARPALVQGLP